MQVTAKKGAEGPQFTVEYEFGEDLAEAVKIFGEDVVFHHARSSMVVALQGIIRTAEDQKQADAKAAEWKPGIRQRGKSATEKMLDSFENLDEDVQKEMLKQLQAKLRAAGKK